MNDVIITNALHMHIYIYTYYYTYTDLYMHKHRHIHTQTYRRHMHAHADTYMCAEICINPGLIRGSKKLVNQAPLF